MIKINLLAPERTKRARKPRQVPLQMGGVIGLFLAVFVVIGYAWWYLSNTIDRLNLQTVL